MSGISNGRARLRAWAPAVVLAIGVLAIWAVFSWPLPRLMGEGIASSSQNREIGAVRRMIPGDHLQLLYHYWLAGDMLAGRTPPFANVYEFNTGDDAARRRIHAQYAPFSWVYAAISAVVGRAAGMNLTGLVSLWLTAWLTMRLARRHTDVDALAVLAGWIAILVPFRWVSLLGGSPAGHAMAWIPLIFLGVDILVRDLRASGGLLVGLGLLFASWGDSHILFFGALGAAGWGVAALAARGGWPWRDRAAWIALAKATAAALVALLPALIMLVVKARYLRGTTAGGSRDLAEIGLFTPAFADFFRWAASGLSSHVYVGWTLPALAALAMLGWLAVRDSGPEVRRRAFVFLLLLAGSAVVLVLATGGNGPMDGLLWRAARKLIPPYHAVRQPAKIFCLLPTLAAVGLAAGLSVWAGSLRGTALRAAAAGLLALGVAWEMKAQVRATVCLLDMEQGAYRAAAEHAKSTGSVPRILVLPVWPGDSTYGSVYLHYASLYRIRMANGYSPAVRREYIDGFYARVRGFNHGRIGDDALDALSGMGIQSVLFHEDLFPLKVSPFPAGRTLEVLRRHPRLRLLAQDGPVWAFAILPRDAARPEAGRDIEPYAGAWPPARCAEGEKAGPRMWEISAPDCSGGAFSVLSSEKDRLTAPRVSFGVDPAAAWRVRVRGAGTLSVAWSGGGGEDAAPAVTLPVQTGGTWIWIRVPPPDPVPQDGSFAMALGWAAGRVELDVMYFGAGTVMAPAAGERRVLPAATFFRAGHTLAGGAVEFLRERDASDRIFYGPGLPLAPGRYVAELEFHSTAPAGVHLGSFAVERNSAPAVPVVAGATHASVEFVQTADTPLTAGFTFSRLADVVIERLALLRLE